jgi:hypothetical protein
MTGAYVDSMPREAMRAVAKFPISGGSFFLPRTTVAIPEELEKLVFPSVEAHLDAFSRGEYEQDIAGVAFLNMLRVMRKILLQDCAVLRRNYPAHPLFLHPIFQRQDFRTLELAVLESCDMQAPVSMQLQLAMPALSNMVDVGFRSTVQHVQIGNAELMQKLETTERHARMTRDAVNDFFSGRVPIVISPHRHQQPPDQEGRINTTPASPSPAGPSTVTNEDDGQQATVRIEPPTPTYKMSRTITSVVDLYREYTEGLGGNMPVRELEKNYGIKWRRSEADRKFFNRRKVIYDEIARMAEAMAITPDEAAVRLENRRLGLKPKSFDALEKDIKKARQNPPGQG